jgi:hypothetical protein
LEKFAKDNAYAANITVKRGRFHENTLAYFGFALCKDLIPIFTFVGKDRSYAV